MKVVVSIFLIFALALPVSARKRKRSHTARHRPVARAVTCPPPVIKIAQPDVVQVISQDDEAALQAAIARWMRGQPEMSEAAQNKAREVAEKWYRLGRESVRQGQANRAP